MLGLSASVGLFFSIIDTPGGLPTIIDLNQRYGRFHALDWSFNPTVRHTVWGLCVFNFFNWMLYAVQPAYVQRMAALRSKRDCYIAATVGGAIWIFFCSFPSWAGVNIFGYYASKGCDVYARGWAQRNDIISYYVRDRVNFPGFQGLFLASLFAGSLSSLSSALNAFSALVWDDVIRPRLPFAVTEVRAVICSKSIVVLAGVLGMSWCFGLHSFGSLILQLAQSLDASLYGAYFALCLFSATVVWINAKGAIVGVVVSFAFTGWLAIGSLLRGKSSAPHMQTTMENCPPAAAVNATDSIPVEVAQARSLLDSFYSISYLYFPALCLLVFLSVALVVSLCTGRKKGQDPRLLLPGCRRFRCCVEAAAEEEEEEEEEEPKMGAEERDEMVPMREREA